MAEHHFSFLMSTLTGEEQIGPISQSQFIEQIRKGNVKRKTKVHSASQTKNQWVTADKLPIYARTVDQLKKEQAIAEAKDREVKESAKNEAREQKAQAMKQKASDARKLALEKSTLLVVENDAAFCPYCSREVVYGSLKCPHCTSVVDKRLYKSNMTFSSFVSGLSHGVMCSIALLVGLLMLAGAVLTATNAGLAADLTFGTFASAAGLWFILAMLVAIHSKLPD